MSLEGASYSGQPYTMHVSARDNGQTEIGIHGPDREEYVRIPKLDPGAIDAIELVDSVDEQSQLNEASHVKLFISGMGRLNHLKFHQKDTKQENEDFQIRFPSVVSKNHENNISYIGKLKFGNIVIQNHRDGNKFEVEVIDDRLALPASTELVNGGEEWSTWGACSVSCGAGRQTRRRPCDEQSVARDVFSNKSCVDHRQCSVGSCEAAKKDMTAISSIGGNSVLRCNYDPMLPVEKFYWKTPGGRRIEPRINPKYSMFGKYLVIQRVGALDEGDYRCVLVLTNGDEMTADAHLAVQDCTSRTVCHNGGQCVQVGKREDPELPFNHVKCKCANGYTGDFCRIEAMENTTKLMVAVFLLALAVVVLVCLCWCRISNNASTQWDKFDSAGHQGIAQIVNQKTTEEYPTDIDGSQEPLLGAGPPKDSVYMDLDTCNFDSFDVSGEVRSLPPLPEEGLTQGSDAVYEMPIDYETASTTSSAMNSESDYVNFKSDAFKRRPTLAERLSLRRKQPVELGAPSLSYGSMSHTGGETTTNKPSVTEPEELNETDLMSGKTPDNASTQVPISIWQLIKVGQKFKQNRSMARTTTPSPPPASEHPDENPMADVDDLSNRDIKMTSGDEDEASQADSNINQNNPRCWSGVSYGVDDRMDGETSSESDESSVDSDTRSESSTVTVAIADSLGGRTDEGTSVISASTCQPASSVAISSTESDGESMNKLDQLFDDVEETLNRALQHQAHLI